MSVFAEDLCRLLLNIGGDSAEAGSDNFGNEQFKKPLLSYLNHVYPMGHEARFVLKSSVFLILCVVCVPNLPHHTAIQALQKHDFSRAQVALVPSVPGAR